MIRILLRQKMDEMSFETRKRVTMNEIADTTGISRPTLTRIANVPGYNTNTDTIDSLCKFFKCTPGELLMYVDE